MIIPVPRASGGKRALFVIDAQPQTLSAPVCEETVQRIADFVRVYPYDAYVVAEYWASPECMFTRQSGYPLSREEAGPTDARILRSVEAQGRPVYRMDKTSTSCFEGPKREELCAFLEEQGIVEGHFVGFDVNDCVLASLMSFFDRGYWAFLLEELAHHNEGLKDMYDAALVILGRKHATNHSALSHIVMDRVEI